MFSMSGRIHSVTRLLLINAQSICRISVTTHTRRNCATTRAAGTARMDASCRFGRRLLDRLGALFPLAHGGALPAFGFASDRRSRFESRQQVWLDEGTS
jgi:hypothetical protein